MSLKCSDTEQTLVSLPGAAQDYQILLVPLSCLLSFCIE